MGNRIQNIIWMAALLLIPCWFLAAGGSVPDGGRPQSLLDYLSVLTNEDEVKDNMPMGMALKQLGLDIRLAGGEKEQNGIFISKEALMRKTDPPLEPHVRDNTEAIQEFARQLGEVSSQKKHVYVAVIPTSAGVQQQYLPRFANSQMINQQRLIEELYGRVSDTVYTVDAFSALQNRREQYIFYRTENNLSALGGYYVYTAIARRLGFTDKALSQFDIDYVEHSYYGNLYQASPGRIGGRGGEYAPYRDVTPDILALYRYSKEPREYTVTHRGNGDEKVYHTLYPTHLMELGQETNIYLGGVSAITEVTCSAPTSKQLLIFGDKTAQAYLPFLINHYQRITLVNLYQMAPGDYELINPDNYDNVLFAYDLETYIHTNSPSLVHKVVWDQTG